jgi:glucosamine--fructose-6-phosphate aminotransferase (isomerizing)
VIGISQSGQSVDVGQVVSDAQAQGAITVSITNDPESPMAQSSAFHLPLHCEEEISIAATKTYTAELTAIAMLVSSLVDGDDLEQELTELPNYVAETVRQSQAISNWVQRYRYMDHVVVIGRGYNYCTAFEISLKIKELCYVTGEEYSEADFRHGPIAVIQPGFPVIVVAPEGKPLPGLIDLLKQLRTKQAECIVISNNETALSYGENITQLPEIPEWLSPVVSVIPGQVFAMRLALTKGHTVDRPEGLTKVTITR